MFLYPLARLEMVSIQIAIYHSRTPPWKVLRDRSFVSVHTSDLAGASVLSSSTIWRFPNMEVPISMGFSPINHPAMGGIPIDGHPPFFVAVQVVGDIIYLQRSLRAPCDLRVLTAAEVHIEMA